TQHTNITLNTQTQHTNITPNTQTQHTNITPNTQTQHINITPNTNSTHKHHTQHTNSTHKHHTQHKLNTQTSLNTQTQHTNITPITQSEHTNISLNAHASHVFHVCVPAAAAQSQCCVTESHVSSVSSEVILLSVDVAYSETARAHRRARECQDCRRFQKEDLLRFQVIKPRQGLTRVNDLSSEDIKKIGYISLIELTTFYDMLGIELKRNRVWWSKARESGIFGVPLPTLLENDQKKYPGSRVPLVFKKLLSKLEQTGLQTEGILRVPGSAARVKHLRQELELKFYEDRFDWEEVRQNDAAGLLKMFIRELPYPLLTQQHLPAFTAAQNITSPKHQIQALHLLIMLLPEANRDTLKALLEFLSKVVAFEEKNRMSLWNVSMIVAPNLFIFRGKNARQEEMQGAVGSAHLVRLLIKHQDLLWTVPCFLISHVRKLNEAATGKKTPTSEKTKRKLLRRWNAEKDKDRNEVTDLLDGVIKVHAPLHAKVSMAIQLNSEMKARDITARFDVENSRGSRSAARRHKQFLFEVGGNIGERCLDPDTYLLDVYGVNPHCEWVLKSLPT
ncbi:rho GTPase-activating protein 28, partial [Triplophysa rosa]